MQQESRTSKLTAVATAYTRPVQAQATQKSKHERERWAQSPISSGETTNHYYLLRQGESVVCDGVLPDILSHFRTGLPTKEQVGSTNWTWKV